MSSITVLGSACEPLMFSATVLNIVSPLVGVRAIVTHSCVLRKCSGHGEQGDNASQSASGENKATAIQECVHRHGGQSQGQRENSQPSKRRSLRVPLSSPERVTRLRVRGCATTTIWESWQVTTIWKSQCKKSDKSAPDHCIMRSRHLMPYD